MNYIEKDTVLNNRYAVKECVGVGGMAVVYKGYDLVNNIEVALKVLKQECAANEQNVTRFKKEAESAYRLNHPNVVKIYGIGYCGGHHYIAMQYIDGVTLTEYMEKCGVFEWQDAFEIVSQILSALTLAHSSGVIHRDIKPQNILVDEHMHVTLTDFGIAQDKISTNTIDANSSACSVHYIAPEQARGSLVDARSDLYSLGITLYEMFLGKVPFDGGSNMAVMLKHLEGKIVPPINVDENIPKGVSDLVMMATMKDMGKRFQSAEEMLAQMKRVLENPEMSFWDAPIAAGGAAIIDGMETISIPNLDDTEENAEFLDDDDVKSYVPKSEAAAVGAATEDATDEAALEEKILDEKTLLRARNMRIAGKIITYVVAALVALAIVISLVYVCREISPKAGGIFDVTYNIENYEGHEFSKVEAALKEAGIIVESKSVISDKYPIGYIVSQDVKAGTALKSGDTVNFEIAKTEDSDILRDYVEMDSRTAKGLIEGMGLELDVTVETVTGTADSAGTVLKMQPEANSIVSRGDTVILYVSDGTLCKVVTMPDLTGRTLSEAQSIISGLKLNLGVVYPMPGEDVSNLLATPTPDVNATLEPTEAPTEEVPSEIPTEVITEVAANTDGPAPIKDDDDDNKRKPDGKEEATATHDVTATPAIGTDIPTQEPTAEITEEPTATPEITATPEPSPELSSETVVAQYPPKGTKLYEGDTVYIYFYEPSKLREDPVMQTVTLHEEMFEKDESLKIMLEYELENGTRTHGDGKVVTKEEPSLEFYVPFSYGSEITEVYIYINDTNNLYEKRIINKSDYATPIPEETPNPDEKGDS